MWSFSFRNIFVLSCVTLVSCVGAESNVERPAEKTSFSAPLLLGEFRGEESPPCGSRRIEKDKRALALLELGMQGLSISDYRHCYKREFLK